MKIEYATAAIAAVALSFAAAMGADAATTTTTTTVTAKPAPAPAPKAVPIKSTAMKTTTTKTGGGDLTGTWTGSAVQVGRDKSYSVALTLAGKSGQSSYADQHCTGKLTRVGQSGDYSFFTETIVEGKYNPTSNTGCIDGSITLVRSGDSLVMGWAAAYNGKPIIAYATLAAPPK
jgi:hypothetical protein